MYENGLWWKCCFRIVKEVRIVKDVRIDYSQRIQTNLQSASIWVGCHSREAIGRRHLFRLASPWWRWVPAVLGGAPTHPARLSPS